MLVEAPPNSVEGDSVIEYYGITKRVYDEDACYWSKDTYANNHNYADVIDFLDGTESCAHKNLKQYLRCVRDNSEFDEDLDDN